MRRLQKISNSAFECDYYYLNAIVICACVSVLGVRFWFSDSNCVFLLFYPLFSFFFVCLFVCLFVFFNYIFLFVLPRVSLSSLPFLLP